MKIIIIKNNIHVRKVSSLTLPHLACREKDSCFLKQYGWAGGIIRDTEQVDDDEKLIFSTLSHTHTHLSNKKVIVCACVTSKR